MMEWKPGGGDTTTPTWVRVCRENFKTLTLSRPKISIAHTLYPGLNPKNVYHIPD